EDGEGEGRRLAAGRQQGEGPVENGRERLRRGHHQVARIESRVHQPLQDGDRDPVVGVAEAIADEDGAGGGQQDGEGAALDETQPGGGPGRGCGDRTGYRTSQVSPARSSWPRSPFPFLATTCRSWSFIPASYNGAATARRTPSGV